MTTTTYTASMPDGGIRARLDRFFAGVGQGFNTYLEIKARSPELQALYAKSDAELAKMGLKREDIPRHVFRDLYFV